MIDRRLYRANVSAWPFGFDSVESPDTDSSRLNLIRNKWERGVLCDSTGLITQL